MASTQLDRITVTLEMGLWVFLREKTLMTLVHMGSSVLTRGSWTLEETKAGQALTSLHSSHSVFPCGWDTTALFGLPPS